MEQGIRRAIKEDMKTETEVRVMGLLTWKMEDRRRKIVEAGNGKGINYLPSLQRNAALLTPLIWPIETRLGLLTSRTLRQ